MRLSIVIPAKSLVADAVIVADAGSPDGTGEVAAREGVPAAQARKGRGPQLLAGARGRALRARQVPCYSRASTQPARDGRPA